MDPRRHNKDIPLFLVRSVKVMAIDPKNEFHASYVDTFFKSDSFEVTCVAKATDALKNLLEKKDDQFDLLLIDKNLEDMDLITFVRLATDMGIISIVISDEAVNDRFVLEVMENGVYRVVERKLLTNHVVLQARQYVIRERFRKFQLYGHSERTELESGIPSVGTSNNSQTRKNACKGYTGGLEKKSGCSKKKNLEWNEELHSIFIRAVQILGEGRCFPKEILATMGVPGLTRMQVASHLQKCRREGMDYTSSNDASGSNLTQGARFGRMPCIATDREIQEQRTSFTEAMILSNKGHMDENHMNYQPLNGSSSMNNFILNTSGICSSSMNDFILNTSGIGSSSMNDFILNTSTIGSSSMNGFILENINNGIGSSFMNDFNNNGIGSSSMNYFQLHNNGIGSSAMNDFGPENNQIGSSSMNDFILANNGIGSSSMNDLIFDNIGISLSSRNDFRLEKNGTASCVAGTSRQGSDLPNLPANHASDSSFNNFTGMEENASFGSLDHLVFEPACNYLLEDTVHPYSPEINLADAFLFDQQLLNEVDEGKETAISMAEQDLGNIFK